MISESMFFNIIIVFSFIAIIILFLLFFITAPYGFNSNNKWGLRINPRLGWIIMEFMAPCLFTYYYLTSNTQQISNLVAFSLFFLWQFHYFYRAFIYPFTVRKPSPMPLIIALSGLLFQTINTWIQAYWIYRLAPSNYYNNEYLTSWQFLIGTSLFFISIIINRQSDYILRQLRKDGSTGYKIPYGGLYTYISSPNYFSEFCMWLGWAILTWSWAGASFALWTFANLFPRAYAKHQWYQKNMEGYPENRKSFFPFII